MPLPFLLMLFQAGPAVEPPADTPIWYGKDIVREPATDGWFKLSDYPSGAKRRNEQGRVVITLMVGPSGTPTVCWVKTSSGYPDLDETSCLLALRRGTFTRTKAAYTWSMPVRWQLEE